MQRNVSERGNYFPVEYSKGRSGGEVPSVERKLFCPRNAQKDAKRRNVVESCNEVRSVEPKIFLPANYANVREYWRSVFAIIRVIRGQESSSRKT